MKFGSSVPLLFLALVPRFSWGGGDETSIENRLECVDASEFTEDYDYFPDKVSPDYSKFWKIDYHQTYKILTNTKFDKSYLLYQCGTGIPESEREADHDGFFPVPLPHGVALESTTQIPFLELLGLRKEIQGYLGLYSSSVYSPCLRELLADGHTVVAENMTDPTDVQELLKSEGAGSEMVAFTTSDTLIPNTFYFTENEERTNLAKLEWVKFASALFNYEAVANRKFDDIVERLQCTEKNAATLASDEPQKPTVLWARYTNYTGIDGFDVGECPNYYCEIADVCSAQLLLSTVAGSRKDAWGNQYMSVEEFLPFAKDAEYWMYPSGNWDELYGIYKDQIDEMASVKSKQVYGQSPYATQGGWFERRFVTPDAVVQDFCTAVGTTRGGFHNLVYFRNVFAEDSDEGGQSDEGGVCEDADAALDTKGTECVIIPVTPTDNTGTSAATRAGTRSAALAVLAAAVVTFAAWV